MKIEVIKRFEIGDCCFFVDPKERRYMEEQIHPATMFGQIIGISKEGLYTIKILCEDGQLVTAATPVENIEWYDFLYDMGPQTIGTKYGSDLGDDFATRGLFFKAAMRSDRLGEQTFQRGDVVFDLDRRAEQWFNDYITNNHHEDTFGIIDGVNDYGDGRVSYVINYGEEMPFERQPYEIGRIQRFPKVGDEWRDEYTLTRMDHMRLDMLEAGNLDEYISAYLVERDRLDAKDTAQMLAGMGLDVPDEIKEMAGLTDEDIENMKPAPAEENIVDEPKPIDQPHEEPVEERIEPVWIGEDPATKDAFRSDVGVQPTSTSTCCTNDASEED